MADDQNWGTGKRRRQSESMWSDIHIGIVELVLKKLASIDILRFKAVRSSWKYAANSYITAPYYTPLPQSPWLVLDKGQEDNSCRFFSLEEKKVYTIKNVLFEGRTCVGSSLGWLVIINKDSIFNLLNPISGETIQLPAVDGFSNFSSSDDTMIAVLSSEPSRRNKFFFTICTSQNLVVYKHEDKTWVNLLANPGSAYIAFHNSKLFAMLTEDVVQVWDFKKPSHDMSTVYHFKPTRPSDPLVDTRSYIVESTEGEVLRVTAVMVKKVSDSLLKEWYFEVHKMNLAGTATWERVESLGHRIIMLCRNGSMALSASKFTGFEENSIYLCCSGGIIIFYNLKDRVMKLRSNAYESDELTKQQPPFCIVPNISLN